MSALDCYHFLHEGTRRLLIALRQKIFIYLHCAANEMIAGNTYITCINFSYFQCGFWLFKISHSIIFQFLSQVSHKSITKLYQVNLRTGKNQTHNFKTNVL